MSEVPLECLGLRPVLHPYVGWQGEATGCTEICVRAARPSGRARCGAGAGCSAMKYKSLRAAVAQVVCLSHPRYSQ